MEPACSYWFDAFETYVLPDDVGACGSDGKFYPCLGNGGFGSPKSCASCTVNPATPKAGFPETYAGYDPGTCVACTEGEQRCLEPFKNGGGTPFYSECNEGKWVTQTCSGGALCHDFVNLDHGADTYGLRAALCGGECTPYVSECGGAAGKQIRTCARTGTLGDFVNCEYGACTMDDLLGTGAASCEAECIPGTSYCPVPRGSQQVGCSPLGRFDELAPRDCNPDEVCIDGIGCAECDDGRTTGRPWTRCDPDDATRIQACRNAVWESPVPCPGSPTGGCVASGDFASCTPEGSSGSAGSAGMGGAAGSSGGAGMGGTAGSSGGAGMGGTAGSAGAGASGASGSAGQGGTSGQGGTAGTSGDAGTAGLGGVAGDLG